MKKIETKCKKIKKLPKRLKQANKLSKQLQSNLPKEQCGN